MLYGPIFLLFLIIINSCCKHNWFYEFGENRIRICLECGKTQKWDSLTSKWVNISREEFNNLKSKYSSYES